MFGYLTSTSWNYFIAPQKFHVDFPRIQSSGNQPAISSLTWRGDVPPGMKTARPDGRARRHHDQARHLPMPASSERIWRVIREHTSTVG